MTESTYVYQQQQQQQQQTTLFSNVQQGERFQVHNKFYSRTHAIEFILIELQEGGLKSI